MGKVIPFLVITLGWLWAQEHAVGPKLGQCAECHRKNAPPLAFVYRRYLMLYSAKSRVRDRMVDFLTAPSRKKSAMPRGMKNRFNPQNHPAYSRAVAEKAVENLIEKEDIIPHIVIPQKVPQGRGD